MNPTLFEDGLFRLLRRTPFQPFAIEFADGDRFVVVESRAINYGGGQTALFFGANETHMFHSEAVRRLVELTPANAGT